MQQRKERMSTPPPRKEVGAESGYAVIVNGQAKAAFTASDQALKAAVDLKGRFPMLQIKVYDAKRKRSEAIELAVAQQGAVMTCDGVSYSCSTS
jgi:hypothetical protein